ncbi:hypothetical protein ACRAWD_06610 [Caulobacter segnis]
MTFPSGREANLARDLGDVRKWLDRLAPVDESLRARSVPRFVSTDEGWLAYYGRGLSPEDQARLRGSFRPLNAAARSREVSRSDR